MKRVVGLILIALGVMMLVLAPLLRFYVMPSAAKSPLDQYSESKSDVMFEKYFDIDKLLKGNPNPYQENFAATQYVYVRGDVPAAEQPEAKSQDLAIYDYFMRVERNDDGSLVQASTARYPNDRVTSELNNCCGANVNEKTVNMSGMMPIKFGFFVQKQDYQQFNATTNTAVTVSYQGEEEKFGINCYVFKMVVPPTKVQQLDVPTNVLPGESPKAKGNTTVDFMYSNTSTYWVEPLTGQIVFGTSDENDTLNKATGEELFTAAKYTGAVNEQVAADGAVQIKTDAGLIKMVGTTAPLVLGLLGIVLLVIGILLSRGGASGGSAPASAPEKEPASA